AIRVQESQLAQQFLARHCEQRAYAGVLQRRNRKAALLQNGLQPTGQAGAKTALGIKEQPAFGMPPFSVCVFARQ
ncbi:MAG TPA: hypothetical protein VFB10_00990, partial [Candidatus Dormibacteraeota bacterium]|nr:hypothetical protein [Candidatus Dormibacteraeota bacterium]